MGFSEFQLGRLRMRILDDAKVFSRCFCVAVGMCMAMAVLMVPGSATALPDEPGRWNSNTSDIAEGLGTWGNVGLAVNPAAWDISDIPDGISTIGFGPSVFIPDNPARVDEAGLVLLLDGAAELSIQDTPTVIPEPAPLAILGLAILALGFCRRRLKT